MTIYNKLVRDKIAEIIEEHGETPVFRRLSPGERLDALIAKLFEEAYELKEKPCLDELADIQEVVNAIGAELGHEPAQIEEARRVKSEERGGFSLGIYLEKVE